MKLGSKLGRHLDKIGFKIGTTSGQIRFKIGTTLGWHLDNIETTSSQHRDDIGMTSGQNRDDIGTKSGWNVNMRAKRLLTNSTIGSRGRHKTLCWPENLNYWMTRGMGPRPKSCFDRLLVLLYKLCHSIAAAAVLLSCPSLALGAGR